MSTIDRTTTLVELATLISEALEVAGITSTLSGGAVVSIYTLNEYESSGHLSTWSSASGSPGMSPSNSLRC